MVNHHADSSQQRLYCVFVCMSEAGQSCLTLSAASVMMMTTTKVTHRTGSVCLVVLVTLFGEWKYPTCACK